MPSRLLVRHFLGQFVENDFSPDADRHQVLALAASGLVTIPMFVTVFMSVKFLMRPLQAPGWTATTAMGDEVAFCAASMLVTAVIAVLEWDSLALSPRDAVILGVLPVPHRAVVRAKVVSLLTFAAAFVVALNAVPTLLHPAFMAAQLPMYTVLLLPLMAAHGLATMMAGAFGFSCVLGLREGLYLVLGRQRFSDISDYVRSGLLFALLMLLALIPIRLSGSADWMFAPRAKPALLVPVSWFAGTHAAIAGRVLERVSRPRMPPRLAAEEDRLSALYRRSLPEFTALALRGAAALATTLALSLAMYLWNARRLHVLSEAPRRTPFARLKLLVDALTAIAIRRPARRAGVLFVVKTLIGSPIHRVYLIVFTVAGLALLIAMAPDAAGGYHGRVVPVRTLTLAAQTLMLCSVIAGFRAAIRTSADPRASWLFGVAETGGKGDYRDGVRLAAIAATLAAVVLLFPLHALAWGLPIAAAHAVNGAALGWLLVEIAIADVEQPLVSTIPPSDGLNTVGVGLLGAAVIAIFVLAHIELAALTAPSGKIAFVVAPLALATWVRTRTGGAA